MRPDLKPESFLDSDKTHAGLSFHAGSSFMSGADLSYCV